MTGMASRQRAMVAGVVGAALGALAPAAGAAGVRDDDLQVVKRAVQETGSPQAAPETPRATAADERPARSRGSAPQWLRVRISEKSGKRVRVNLPLALVRAVGDWPIEIGCHRNAGGERSCSRIRLSEVLQALDKGESLVEIEGDDANVRVWVE